MWIEMLCRANLLCQWREVLRLAKRPAKVHWQCSAREGPNSQAILSPVHLFFSGRPAPHHFVWWDCNEPKVSSQACVRGEPPELSCGARWWERYWWNSSHSGNQSLWASPKAASIPGKRCRCCRTCKLWRCSADQKPWLYCLNLVDECPLIVRSSPVPDQWGA